MKMACLLSSVSRNAGGLHESVRRLAQSMQAGENTDVRVLGLRDVYTDQDIASWAPLSTYVFPVQGPWQFGYAPQLKPALFEMDLDILQIHGLWMYPSVAANSWHQRTGRPFIVNPHGMLDPWAVKNSRWKKRVAGFLYEHATLRRASCIRALCHSEAKAIRAYGLINPICVIPNGIDIPTSPETVPPPWAGKIEPGRKVLFYLGRLHPKKGLPNLLRAWAQLHARKAAPVENWDLAIAGWSQGGHEEELKELTRQVGIAARVHFLGPQFGEAKASAYHHANAFVLPSFSEGLPMVVLEAWAHHVPVVMTSECNLPEGFAANAAIRIETGVEQIAAGLETLLSMRDEERRAMGARGHNLVAQRFAWSRIASDLRAVCSWTLGGGNKPACVLNE